jgi:hypothetical protein
VVGDAADDVHSRPPSVKRPIASALALLLAGGSLAAQEPFVAPDSTTVIGSAEAGSTKSPSHRFYVMNRSSIAIVVDAFELRGCDNVAQACERVPTSVTIAPGGRGQVGRADARTRNRRFSYQWTFAYRADTSDATVVAAMREHGLIRAQSEPAVNLAKQVGDTTSPFATGAAPSRERITAEERQTKIVALDANNRPIPLSEKFRFKVAYGSILGSTKTPGSPVRATGACINPAEAAKFDGDTTISRHPAHPPVLGSGLTLPTLPPELRDSTLRTGDVVVQWAVDTTGDALPGSVSVLESPHGMISVKVCGAVIGSHLAPATDENGKPVRAWVQLPIKFTK